MSKNKEFSELLITGIKANRDVLSLRQILIKLRDNGMSKFEMLDCLGKLRTVSGEKTEDVLLELMDFVSGYCNPDLRIFEE